MVPKTMLNPGMLQHFSTNVHVLAMTFLEQNSGRHHTLSSTTLVFRENKLSIQTAQEPQNTPKSCPAWTFRRLRPQGLPVGIQEVSLGIVPVKVLASFISKLNLQHSGSTSRF